ncbi:MAG TPA: hypothetical protein VMD59_19710, partial [Acidimicrobiales bacterium]|nr:hypothetical protein [Acidimicrobiales bacterium]
VTEVEREELLEAYAAAVLGALDPHGPRRLHAVYSPVHGVGGEVLPWLFERAGFRPPDPVPTQSAPDPDFPTAPFPNPEEPGVLDLALAQAEETGADIVIANDPDADRLAVAVPGHGGGWRALTGDEVGALLGSDLIARKVPAAAGDGDADGDVPVVACSIVSSTLLGKIAASAGVHFVETLTGFKWIARAADDIAGGRLLFGYEEALGYAVSPAVRDKDGLSAALLVAELAARARETGETLVGALDELEARFGVHLTSQWSLRLSGPGAQHRLAAIVDRWRRQPPARLGGLAVTRVVDLGAGDAGLPATDGVLLELAELRSAGHAAPNDRRTGRTGPRDPRESDAVLGDPSTSEAASGQPRTGVAIPGCGSAGGGGATGRVVVRPSGTEPKLKAYLEIVLPPGGDGAQDRAAALLHALRSDVATGLDP